MNSAEESYVESLRAELKSRMDQVDSQGQDLGEALDLLVWSGVVDGRAYDFEENQPYYDRLIALFEKYEIEYQ